MHLSGTLCSGFQGCCMKEMGVRAGRKDVVGSACTRAGVWCSLGAGGERLERDVDPDRTSIYRARGWGGGSVCARWKPQGVRVGTRSGDFFSWRLAVVLFPRVPEWHRAPRTEVPMGAQYSGGKDTQNFNCRDLSDSCQDWISKRVFFLPSGLPPPPFP